MFVNIAVDNLQMFKGQHCQLQLHLIVCAALLSYDVQFPSFKV